MTNKKLADKLFLIYREETSNNTLQLQFRECLNILLARKVSSQMLYELFHEFGHYTKAVEQGAVVSFVCVAQFIFTFPGRNVRYTLEEDNKVSATLSYYDDETNLLENIRQTIYNGMHYSHLSKSIRQCNLRVYLFNRVNSPGWKKARPGSDNYLYKNMASLEEAVKFNTQAKRLAGVFKETESIAAVIESSKVKG